ncbi:hypothetical protein DB30_01551 [Enhygromyxa salina]|uniref:DUF3592 domain-containing protein n=1 Tax=Enhygromyxa salina TaxID=215803 RepID=A0A0C2CRU3_9BACT|nr:DUF3592 domain-containing protein [Enhygromyxa salina]KIG12360.1 hypothetical protein DB30_01551 [Enhygromyxa salina]
MDPSNQPRKPLEPVELPPGIKWIAIGVVLVVVLGLITLVAAPMLLPAWQEHQLLENGTDATAKILKIIDTRDKVNENPVVQLSVEVHPEGGEPYRAAIVTPLSAVDLKNYDVGGMVRVRFDPKDPKKVALVGPITPAPQPKPAQPKAAQPKAAQ